MLLLKTPIHKDSDAQSEFFDVEAAVEENEGGDTFEFVADPNRSVRNEDSSISDFGSENAVPVNQQAIVAAFKIMSSHPMRDIARKT